MPPFMVVAHAGGAGYHPHNTGSAVRNALAMRADVIEFDVQVTRDHVPVLHHDFVIEAEEGMVAGQWPDRASHFIRDMTLPELREWNIAAARPGSRGDLPYPFRKTASPETIVTLDEVLDLIAAANYAPVVFVEVKSALDLPAGYRADVLARDVTAVIRRHRMEKQVAVISFDWRVLGEVRKRDSTIRTVYVFRDPLVYAREFAADMRGLGVDVSQLTPEKIIDRLTDGAGVAGDFAVYADFIHARGGWMLDAYKDDATDSMMRRAHALGLKTGVWTVDTLVEAGHAVAMGTDAVTTNYPDVVGAAWTRKGGSPEQ